MRPRAAAATLALLAGCSEELPPDLGGQPLWRPVMLEGAQDLGHAAAELDPGARRASGAIHFSEVAQAMGLGDAVAGGNSHGVGVGFVDLDGDGYPEIFVAAGKPAGRPSGWPSRLYRNDAGRGFIEVTAAAGLEVLASVDTFSVAAGDYDLDGDLDLYLGALPTDVLLRNEGGLRFTDVSAAAGAGGPPSDSTLALDGRSKVVAFGDYDGDGWLDLVSASSTLPRPYAYLLRNTRDGRFTDVSAASGVLADPEGNPCAVMWSDYDNDADPDLWIWNDRGGHVLLRNEGGQRLSDVTVSSKLSEVGIVHPMGIDAADIDHDGDLDYYLSNIGDNPLLRNNGDGTFTDITHEAGTPGEFGWGLSFQDFDADGYADLFVAQEDDLPYLVLRNLGASPPRFEQQLLAHPPVLDQGAAHNVPAAFADFDQDGRMDVLLAHTDGSKLTLYRNDTELGSHRWLEVRVPGSPGSRNAGGVGARVAIRTGGLVQFRDLTGGSSRASQNELSARFGLGDWSGAEWVVLLWPDGQQRVLTGVEGSQVVRMAPP